MVKTNKGLCFPNSRFCDHSFSVARSYLNGQTEVCSDQSDATQPLGGAAVLKTG